MEQVGSAYAAALVETAQAKGSLDAVHADVDTLQVRRSSGRRKKRRAGNSAAALPKVADRKERDIAFSPSSFSLLIESALSLVHWLQNGRLCAPEGANSNERGRKGTQRNAKCDGKRETKRGRGREKCLSLSISFSLRSSLALPSPSPLLVWRT